ncbi:MAG: hypothetical protein IPM82_20810 [Saprospiraceae bacterium]|nr:hypothetical protein [Saprospiraceae bacterium]
MKQTFQRFTCLLALLVFNLSLFAQNDEGKKNEKPINQYKNEIALDFQNAFRNLVNGFSDDDYNSEAIATSLIFRRRIGEKKFISVNEKKALRLQLGGTFSIPISSEEIYDSTLTGTSNLFNIKESRTDVYSYIGIEWQRQFDKLQVYYGLDSGVRYYKDLDVPTVISSTSGQVNYWREINYRSISIPLIGFAGVKYYFHPRFSLSYELSLGTAISFIKNRQDRFEPGIEGPAEREFNYRRTGISGNSSYLRYFNVSYYF